MIFKICVTNSINIYFLVLNTFIHFEAKIGYNRVNLRYNNICDAKQSYLFL